MIEIFDSSNNLQRQLNKIQSSVMRYDSADWVEAEEFDVPNEVNNAELLIDRSTTGSYSYVTTFYSQSAMSVVLAPRTELQAFILISQTESWFTNNSWLDFDSTETALGFLTAHETHWIQDFEHTSYQLRQPIPILVNRADDVVKAKYYFELDGSGGNVEEAISDLCGKIFVHYEAAQKYADHKGNPSTQQHSFFKQMIVETQPKAWEEIKQLYAEKLKAFPYVDKGYIDISAPDYADVIIILSDESAERIKQLAEIDLEINLKFRPLNFFVEYESSEKYLDLKNFERFYQSTPQLAP